MNTHHSSTRHRWTLHPPRGFRLAPGDVLLLALAALPAWGLREQLGAWAWLPLMVVGHFFLFCNVFRVARRLELTWAVAFILNLAAWSGYGEPEWLRILALQTPLTIGVILYEISRPYYHGIGSTALFRRRNTRQWVRDHIDPAER